MEEKRHRLIQKRYFDSFNWAKNREVYNFLMQSVGRDIPIYLYDHSKLIHVFIVSVLVSSENLKKIKCYLKENPDNWNIKVTSVYGYGYDFDDNKEINAKLYPPLLDSSTEILAGSIPILFLRYHPLQKESPAYVEINQQISHPHNLHYDSNLKSYIRLNELGDPDEVVKIVLRDRKNLVTMNEEVLNFHCHLGKYTHIRFFDFTRKCSNKDIELFENYNDLWNNDIFKGKTGNENGFTWLRGFQIMPQTMSDETFMDLLLDRENRKYVSFLIQDWRNKRIVEWTSDPGQLGNYFVESDLPFEISPAFFSKEVLKKYKDNPGKYFLTHWRIECRGGWGIPYNINDADQVSAFIKDLSYLPYKEQLHWKQYNEKPKASLSKTTIRRAFFGEWVNDDDPLIDLKKELQNDLTIDSQVIWKTPSKDEIQSINYLTSDNQKEWESDFSILKKVIIESFIESKIRKAVYDICQPEEKERDKIKEMKSIALLQLYLRKISIKEESVAIITEPLFEVNSIRNKISNHKLGSQAQKKIKEIKHTFGSFTEHHKDVIIRLRDSIRTLRMVLEKEK
jgi:hypothetical protein